MRDYILHQARSHEGTYAFPAIRRVVANWWKRRTLRQLRDLDDYLLHDIGLTRDEISAALRLPLDIDPVAELNRRSRLRPVGRRMR